MKIARLITVNWGTIESREWLFGNATLLTGESGSGKSTLLDAVQAVLTAARSGIFHFNAGQNESTQTRRGGKEPRTLHSYALGQTGNDLFVRGRATCYAALVFEATTEAGETLEPFTAVLGVEAAEENGRATGPRPLFFVVRRALNLHHLCRAGLPEKKVEPLALRDVYLQLQHRMGVGAETVNRFENKEAYLQHLYGALMGKSYVPYADAERCGRALVKAMAYKEIGNVNDLVRDEILDEKDFSADVTKMRHLMQEIAKLKAEAERLELNIKRLNAIDDATVHVLGGLRRFVVSSVAHAGRLKDETEIEISRTNRQIELQARRNALSAQRLERIKGEQKQLNQQLDVVKAQLANNDVARQKDALMMQATQHAEQFRRDWNQLKDVARSVSMLLTRVNQLLSIDVSLLPVLDEAVQRMRPVAEHCIKLWSQTSGDLQVDAGLDDDLPAFDIEALDAELSELEQLLRGDHPASLLATIIGALAEVQNRQKALATEQEQLTAELTVLQAGGSPAPDDYRIAVELLKHELPDSQPKMLAELVEPKKGSTWQQALEGYMGRDRFSIFVTGACESRAIRLVKRRFPKRSPKVVQGERVLKDMQNVGLQPWAVLNEMEVRHPVARAYLLGTYGRLRKVDSEDELRMTPMGLMEKGLGSRGYGMFSCWAEEHELAFGMETRKKREDWVRGRLDFLSKELGRVKSLAADLRQVSSWFNSVAPATLATPLEEALSTRLKYQAVRSALDALDTSSIDALEAQRLELESKIGVSNEEHDKEMRAVGVQEAELKAGQDKLKDLEDRLPRLDQGYTNAQVWITRFVAASGTLATEVQLLEEARRIVRDSEPTTATLKNHVDGAPEQLRQGLQMLRMHVDTYLSGARTDEERFAFPDPPRSLEQLETVLRSVQSVQAQVREQVRRQDSIGLAENVQKLQSAEVQFNTVFTSSFCFKVRDDIKTGLNTLQKLNKELRNIQFGYDSYELVWKWKPRFEGYFEFFEAMDGMVDTLEKDKLSLFESPRLSEEHRETANAIKKLLLSEDQVASEKALKEMADYRNYRHYDINRIVAGQRTPMSTWGTGSGGELETPFYVIRSAVLAHALGHFGRSKDAPALRLMLSDEAFSKMDESRSRAVLRFLSQSMGMQLVVAMPTSKSGAIKPEFDKEYTFSKIEAYKGGKTLYVSEVQDKDLKRDALGQLWDAHARAARASARADYELARKPAPGQAAFNVVPLRPEQIGGFETLDQSEAGLVAPAGDH